MCHTDHKQLVYGWEPVTVDSETSCGVVVWHSHFELDGNAAPRQVWVAEGSHFKNNNYTTLPGRMTKIPIMVTQFLRCRPSQIHR